MLNKQKYKFNERFHNKSSKDISIKGLYGTYGEKSNKNIKSQFLNALNFQEKQKIQEKDQQDRNLPIIKKLQKHVQFLEKKLEDSQFQTQQMNRYVELIKERLAQKDLQSNYLQKELVKNQEMTQKIMKKTQKLQSELQNMKLRSKMQTIYQQATIKQEEPLLHTTLKHQRYTKGMFSSSSSALKISPQRNNGLLKSVIINKTQTQIETLPKSPKHAISKFQLQNPLNEYLIQEWTRTKQQKNDKQLFNAALQNKVTLLKKEIIKQQKEIQILKSQKRQSNELANALEKIRQQQRQYKILMTKYKDCLNKYNQLIKPKKPMIESIGESRIYKTSLEDINGLVYKLSKVLDIERTIFDITILANKSKAQVQMQTQPNDNSYPQKIKSSQILIQKLSQKMVQKQQAFKTQLQMLKQKYQQQIKGRIEQIQGHRLQIQELNLIIQKYEKYERQQDSLQLQRLLNVKQYKNVGMMCEIISKEIWDERDDIVNKATIMYEHNKQLQIDKKELQQKIYTLVKKIAYKQSQDRQTQIQPQYQQNQQSNQQSTQNNQINNRYKFQNIKLKQALQLLTFQKQHFHHQYTQLLILFNKIQKQLEQYRQNQINRQQQLNFLHKVQSDKILQIQRYKKQIIQLQDKLIQFQERNYCHQSKRHS